MNYQEWIKSEVDKPLSTHIRVGQELFNSLCLVKPKLAEQVRGNWKLDPFHVNDWSDAKVVYFLLFVEENWNN